MVVESSFKPSEYSVTNNAGGESSGACRPHHTQQQQPQRETPPTRVRRPDRAVYVPRARRAVASSSPIAPPEPEPSPHIPTEPPAASEVEVTTPSPSKFRLKPKRSIDRNFCNVYKPPHARSTDESNHPIHSKNVNLAISESLPRTAPPCESSQVPQDIHDNNTVPNIECSPLPSTGERMNTSTPETPECAIEPVENGVDSLVDTPADPEHSDNPADDPQEYLAPNHLPTMECEPIVVNPSPNSNLILESNNWNHAKDEDGDEREFMKASEEINRSNRRLIKQSFVSDVLIISDPNKRQGSPESMANCNNGDEYCSAENDKNSEDHAASRIFNPDEEDWEAMFDEGGEWLAPQLMEELTATVGKVSVQKPRMAYAKYQTLATQAFSHVLEIYNFPSEFTTNDLLSVFSDFKDTGFEIKWVDDNHALAVFSSTAIAAEVLSVNHPMVKTRPLHEATHESRMKAKKCAEFLQPYRPRPETCVALARRLVTGALGVRLPTQSQERQQEVQMLTQAREKKRLAAKNREAAWDGSLGET
ncbi:uncharacterized protein LOC143916659 [Arctopsyche grandis]|uniref:uncharacterized protein LOC143916659 n=1 Tax=Arctopsyche grandis TaxID=121162 RepID=UPI00406D8629